MWLALIATGLLAAAGTACAAAARRQRCARTHASTVGHFRRHLRGRSGRRPYNSGAADDTALVGEVKVRDARKRAVDVAPAYS